MTFFSDEYREEDFDDTFFEYARRALEMAGIETDPRLKERKPIRHSMLHSISENRVFYVHARDAVPKDGADWEISEFMRFAIRCCIWDLKWGAIRNYAQFDYLFRRIFGEASRPYLPMVFAGALWSPGLDGDFAAALLNTMPDRQHDDLFHR